MTQGEIEKLTVKTENIFSELEIRIMSDIVRRIKENGVSTALAVNKITAAWNVAGTDQEMDSESSESVRCGNGQDIFRQDI